MEADGIPLPRVMDQATRPDGGGAGVADSGHRAGIRRWGRHIEEVILRRSMFQGRPHLSSSE